MEINGEKTVQVDGVDYLFVNQFANLTGYKESSIRAFLSIGNKIRRMKSIHLSNKPLIPVTELLSIRL